MINKIQNKSNYSQVLRIHDILAWIRICADPCLWLMDPDSDPDADADPDSYIFIIDLQDANKN